MYDKTIADLEEKLNNATMLLRFFKAYLHTQPSRALKVSDLAVQCVTGKESIEVFRDDGNNNTIIKIGFDGRKSNF